MRDALEAPKDSKKKKKNEKKKASPTSRFAPVSRDPKIHESRQPDPHGSISRAGARNYTQCLIPPSFDGLITSS